MNNILRIIASDIKRLSINVVAIVVCIGLSVIPCLYAWFNILSNWDPYGPDSTKNLQVAVASCDQGMVFGGAELNVGDIIVEKLKENTSIGWVFTDSDIEAINGVYSGDYYAALVIDEQFTADMISFLGNNLENPKIVYYENEKKNAIAPKITNKVKNAVKLEIDEAFVSTLAKVVIKASDYLVSDTSGTSVSAAAITKLESLDSDLKAVILILESYISLMDSTENLMEAGEAVSSQIDSMMESAEAMVDSAQASSQSAAATVDASMQLALKTLEKISGGIGDVGNLAQQLFDKIESGADMADDMSAMLEADARAQYNDWIKYRRKNIDKTNADGTITEYGILTDKEVDESAFVDGKPPAGKISRAQKNDIINNVEAIEYYFDKLLGDDYTATATNNYPRPVYIDSTVKLTKGHVYELSKSSDELASKTKATNTEVQKNVKNCQTAINNIIAEYNKVVDPQLDKSVDAVAASLSEVEKLLKYKTTNIDAVMRTLSTYPGVMDESADSLIKARDEAVYMEEKLSIIIEDMKSLQENAQYRKIVELLENDPELLADFISSPVNISEEYIYEIGTNGSASAPFYIVLSIWVGALIMSTILKTTVKNTYGMLAVTNDQCFFGRYFVTWVIGQIQTLITVLGAIFYIGVEMVHPFLFWLACSWISTVFSLLLYSFTYAFGNVGEALSVILMVIQVAGAGGTFPIEVLPKVFQVLYKFMPFNYAMNALRECVGGFYKANYWLYLLALVAYVGVAVFNGLVLFYPCKRLNEQIEKSKEKSGILI